MRMPRGLSAESADSRECNPLNPLHIIQTGPSRLPSTQTRLPSSSTLLTRTQNKSELINRRSPSRTGKGERRVTDLIRPMFLILNIIKRQPGCNRGQQLQSAAHRVRLPGINI
ncbi:hypothetical protein PV05_09096 [Exophiala xenobiotica]|uniref:Uncharacterized protein n=1 Tax=Exophiala xenobiotica TaxID=348802 RepID=A0A0D2BLZ0_9EURO|nr:uncharacterized protein PV05_09096 [Exophiala xenobiotica]KIW53531.1 hypothetical protein PV05_09096 [Exophiala xenobiotica]